jgi:hypothetical protein
MEEEGYKEERELTFFSQDIVALYPSILADKAAEIIEKAVIDSKIE